MAEWHGMKPARCPLGDGYWRWIPAYKNSFDYKCPIEGSLLIDYFSAGFSKHGATYIVSREEDNAGNFLAYIVSEGTGKVVKAVIDENKADVAIQYAIDNLPASGGKVVLSKGDFNISSTIALPPKAFLEGQGGIATAIKNTNTNAANAIEVNAGATSTETQGGIFRLWVQGNDSSGTGIYINYMTNYAIEDIAVSAHGSYGIHAENCYVNTLTSVKVVNNGNYGIYLRQCTAFTISGGMVRDNVSWNIYIDEYGVHHVIGQGFENMSNDVGMIKIYAAVGNVIEGNSMSTVRGGSPHIEIEGTSDTHATDNQINGNRFKESIDTSNGMIYIVNSYVEDTNIVGNILLDAYQYGINFAGTRGVIANNILKNCKYDSGIYVTGNDAIISGNKVYDTGAYGIRIEGDRITVNGNYITTCRFSGILTQPTNHTIIANNLIYNNNQDDSGRRGIHIRDSSYVLIEGNRIYQTHEYGIREYGTSDNNIIRNNDLRGNAVGAIEEIAGANTIVKDNEGYVTENSGTATFSGDGTATEFTISSHGLAENPSDQTRIYCEITPVSVDAKGGSPCECYPTDADGDGNYEALTVKFSSAPAAGTDNVVVRFKAELY